MKSPEFPHEFSSSENSVRMPEVVDILKTYNINRDDVIITHDERNRRISIQFINKEKKDKLPRDFFKELFYIEKDDNINISIS